MNRLRRFAASFILGCVALAALTFLCLKLQLSPPVLYLLVVVFVALGGSFPAAACVSLVAALSLQYFFGSPIFSLQGTDSRHALRFLLWLVTAFVISRLANGARRREQNLKLVMDSIPALVAVGSSETGEGIYGNQKFLDYTGRSPEANGIFVAVRDAGVGIADEDLPHIFDAFYTTKSEGLGMGLAIGRSIIEAHGGRIWATSERARGSTFQFTLPAAEADAS